MLWTVAALERGANVAKKGLTRRERNDAIGRADAANRCAWCRVNLLTLEGPTIETLAGRRFCSNGCFEADQAWATYRDDQRKAQR